MFKIGDFSRLSQVSVRMLRYYDEQGLLKPARVDRFTDYRYYSADQLPRLNRILALRDLGFTTDQIRRLLDDAVSAEQIRGMLKLRHAEIEQQVEAEQARLLRVEARLRQIEMEGKMNAYDIVIKKVEPLRVASVRDVVPTPPDQGSLWTTLEAYLAGQRVAPAGPCLTLYHDPEYKERDWDLEVCEPVSGALPGSDRVQVKELPAGEMACVVHRGPFVTIGEAYNAATQWIEANSYRICGPCREVYLRPAENGNQTDPQTVTEIQFPVNRA